MYHNGRGVPQDGAESARWYRLAVCRWSPGCTRRHLGLRTTCSSPRPVSWC